MTLLLDDSAALRQQQSGRVEYFCAPDGDGSQAPPLQICEKKVCAAAPIPV